MYLSQPSRLLKHSPFFGVLSGKAPPPLSSHPPHQGPYPPMALLSAEKSTPPYYSYFAPPPVVMGAHTHIHPHHLPFPTSVPTLPLVSCAQTYASTHTEMFSLPPLVWLHTTLLLSPTVAVRLQQCSHVLMFTGAFLSPKRLFLPSCLFPLFSPWPPSPSPLLPFHWSILPASPKRENTPPLLVSWLFPNLFNPIHIV